MHTSNWMAYNCSLELPQLYRQLTKMTDIRETWQQLISQFNMGNNPLQSLLTSPEISTDFIKIQAVSKGPKPPSSLYILTI